MHGNGMQTVTAVCLGGTGSFSLNSACWVSPCYGTALWGNEATSSAITRAIQLRRTRNCISGFASNNGNWRTNQYDPNYGSYHQSFPMYSASLFTGYNCKNNIGFGSAPPYLLPGPGDPYEAAKRFWSKFDTQTDVFTWNGKYSERPGDTSSHGAQTYTGVSAIIDNFPNISGYPGSTSSQGGTDPVSITGSGYNMYVPGMNQNVSGYGGPRYNWLVSCDGDTEIEFSAPCGFYDDGHSGPVNALEWKIVSGLSDEVNTGDDWRTNHAILTSSAWNCTSSVFVTNYTGSYNWTYPTTPTAFAHTYGSPAGHNDNIVKGVSEIGSSLCPLSAINMANGWASNVNLSSYGFNIEKGQARLQPVVGGTYSSNYFIVEYMRSTSGFSYWPANYMDGLFTITNGTLAFIDTRSAYLGKYFYESCNIVKEGRIRSDQIIGYGPGVDIEVPFPTDNPNGGAGSFEGDHNVMIDSHWFAVVIGRDPQNWIEMSGMVVPKFGNHYYLVTTSSVTIV